MSSVTQPATFAFSPEYKAKADAINSALKSASAAASKGKGKSGRRMLLSA